RRASCPNSVQALHTIRMCSGQKTGVLGDSRGKKTEKTCCQTLPLSLSIRQMHRVGAGVNCFYPKSVCLYVLSIKRVHLTTTKWRNQMKFNKWTIGLA